MLQRFKATHESLVKTLSNFENMEGHGEPIKLVFRELIIWCHNPNLGLATKERACKHAGLKGSPGFTSCVFGGVKKCEGMNPHTPK